MSSMLAYHRAPLAPTGASHALSVRLTPTEDGAYDSTSNARQRGTVISHLITARDSLIQVWEVREYDTGDGETVAKLQHILSRRLHGTVTSLARVRTLAAKVDGADRVLVCFLDAKMSLMEWTPSAHDLLPVSLHTFEKLPQVAEGLAKSRTDPGSRLSVLLLPSNTGGDATLAILPFFQEELDLEGLGVDDDTWGNGGAPSLPYAPSHLLPLANLTSSHSTFAASKSTTLSNYNPTGPPPVRNIIDLVFLPGFNEPTLALLYAPEQTWPGRIESVSNNCLVSLVTLAANTTAPGSSEAGATTAILIATSPPLPHSCLAVYPCPPALGGLLIITANGVLHLEQGGKVIGAAANGWFGKEWLGVGGGAASLNKPTVREGLEGAKTVFVANDKAIIFCKSGTVLELTLKTSGRSIASMVFRKLGDGIVGSCVERIRGSAGQFGEEGYVFVGSQVGESALLRWEIGGARASTAQGVKLEDGYGMDLDDEDDIYGESTAVKVEEPSLYDIRRSNTVAGEITLSPSDVLEGYGAIRSLQMGLVEADSADLVACTGAGVSAGLTVFHRTVVPRKRRRVSDGGPPATKGLWSLALYPASPNPVHIAVTSDPNFTRLHREDGESQVEFSETTLAAGSVCDASTIGCVTPSHIHLYTSGLTHHSSVALSGPSPAVRATMTNCYILVCKQDLTVELFTADTTQLASIEIPHEFIATLASACLFADSANVIPLVRPKPPPSPRSKREALEAQAAEEDDDLYATAPKRKTVAQANSHAELVIPPTPDLGASSGLDDATGAWNWLPVIAKDGRLDIILLPSMTVIFSVPSVNLFPDVLEDDSAAIPITEGTDPDDIEIDQIICFNVGQSRPRPHLLILLENGSLAIYEAFPAISAAISSSRPATLGVRFVKTLTRRIPTASRARPKPGAAVDALPPPRREFVPFSNIDGYTGAFLTGEDALWLIASDHGPARLLPHGDKGVYGFAAHHGQYITQTREERICAALPPGVCFDRELAFARIPKDRTYNAFTFDIDSGLYVAGALFETLFMNFDEEGQPTFVNESPELLEPKNYRSALELLVPGSWDAVHGYEFRPNEFISSIKSFSLSSRSTASGLKDFIAVGTTVFRAEDLAARGGIYIFEVIKIVQDPALIGQDHQLKLRFFEDTKSVVSNVCDINGYLVMSMGSKLYVRAFEQDEVLLAVGFLDVGVHVTSLESLKNFLLIGDALQSVTLVAFQEDPYKLVVLGRDYKPNRSSSANFLVNDGKLAFIMSDLNGVLRLYEYDPTNIASFAGQKLMCRTEYHAGCEATATLLYAKRSRNEKDELKQNGILYGGVDGSLSTLVPVREIVFKRLQLLQSALTRHIQHFGGLNPRGYRIVKNDSVSRAITKGILDGELLAEFERLSFDRQMEITNLIGTDPDTVLLNLRDLSSW